MNTAFDLIAPRGNSVPWCSTLPTAAPSIPTTSAPRSRASCCARPRTATSTSSTASGPDHGATLIGARFPRSYIDPNRSLFDIDASLLDAPWPGPAIPSAKTQKGIGLIWRVLDSGESIYDRKLGIDEVKQRIVRYHQPYQRAVKDALDAAHEHFGGVWHLNLHSMPAVSGRISDEGPGKARADFVLGDRDGTTCAPEFTALVAEALRAMGYEVKVNDPYKGVELVRAFSDPKANRHSLQVEVNRRLYMDERTRVKAAGFAALKANLDKLLKSVADYAAEHGSHRHDHGGHGHDHDHHHGHGHDHDHDHGHAHSHDHRHKH
jgi:N-formylglutamate deformylase